MPHIQEYLEPGASAPHRQRSRALPERAGAGPGGCSASRSATGGADGLG